MEAPMINRSEMQATGIRSKMATGGKWEGLVPAAVTRIVKEINGVERVKAIAERIHD